MKRFFLSSVLILLSFLYVSGQFVNVTISGTVTDAGNGTPVANHPIMIMADSSSGYSYFTQVFTNPQGIYNDLVSVPANLQVMFYIITTDCNNNVLMQTGMSTNSPILSNFSVCTGTSSNCDAEFIAIPDSTNPTGAFTYYFWDISSGNPISWAWDFGDGTTSNLQYPTHTYLQAGIYNACLTITTASGCSSTYCETITVNTFPSCWAYYTATPDASGYGFQFTDASFGNPTSWLWDFGDGTTSTLQNPNHVYNAAGSFYVCLEISGANCQNSYCGFVYVNGPQSCSAQFFSYPDSSNTNTYYFADFSLGNTIAWSWSFGDGTSSNQQYPMHTYAQTGTYYACLTIYTSDSCTSTYCDTIFVGTNPNSCSSYFTYVANMLYIDFSAWSWGGTAPYTYTWDFGDGSTAVGANPSHTYASAGNYTITLIGTDAAGCISTYTSIITVGNSQPSTIYGQVTADNNILPQGWAFLYVDGGPANPMLMIDSTTIDSAGYYFFMILNPLPGTYYVKAAPAPGIPYFLTHLPTYYGNTEFWANATPINLIQPANPYNIELVPIIPPQAGNGNITGDVTVDGKFNSALIVPAANVEVMLLSMSNTPLGIDFSDNQGHFSFNNLALGTYKIYAEVTGLPTYPAVVTLTANTPTVNDVTVVITPAGVTTGIEDNNTILAVNKMYPNPVKDNVTVEFSLTKSSNVEISLMNILGERIITKSEQLGNGNHRMNIQLQDINAGTYFIQVNTENGSKLTRKITVIK